MKKALTFLMALSLAYSAPAQKLPQTVITDARTGKNIPFSSVIRPGRVTLVTFWGTWCAHGKHQVKTIVARLPVWRKGADFDFIAIAADQQHTEDLVRRYVLSNKWTFPCYIDARSELKPQLHFYALPYTLIVDKHGKIAFSYTGYDDGGRIAAKLKELCGRK